MSKLAYRSSCPVIAMVLWSAIASIACAQGATDWKLIAPPHTLELTVVRQFTASATQFEFRNISQGTILELRVAAPSGSVAGLDAFATGAGAIATGQSTALIFGNQDLQGSNPDAKVLVVEAIIFADGSELGTTATLESVEEEMVGEALETKRASEILTTSASDGIEAADAIEEALRKPPLRTTQEAAESVRGVTLPGIPQSNIDTYVEKHSEHFSIGVNRARQAILTDLAVRKNLAAQTTPRSLKAQSMIQQARLHGISDLATKYRQLSTQHSQHLSHFMGGTHAH